MVTEIFATGKTVMEATEELRKKLAVDTLDEIEWKVVSAGQKGGLFGIGAKPAKVVAFIEMPDPKPEKAAEPQKEAPKKETAKKEDPQKKEAQKRPAKADKPAEKKPAAPKPEPVEKPKKPKSPMTEAEFEAAKKFVDTVVADLELNVTTEVAENEENGKHIRIAGADAGVLIGHHGETLDALQYLANLAANRADGKDDHERIAVDVEGYREKRDETLRALARRMAAKVQKYGRSVVLEPMNPYERRIIHSEVQNIEGVSTNSIGSDSNRKVVIFLTEKGMGKLPPRNDGKGGRHGGDRRRRGPRKPRTEAAEAPAMPASDENE